MTRFTSRVSPPQNVEITQIQCGNDDVCHVCVDIQHVNEAIAVQAWNTRIPDIAVAPPDREVIKTAIRNGFLKRGLSARYEILDDITESVLAALPSEAIGREWQDISTAPKDGQPVDLLYPYPRGRTIDCMWRQGGIDGDGRWIWLKPIWTSQPGLGIDWHLAPEADWEVCSYVNMEPTHWQPLPAPPSDRDNQND